jgi:hypothetical protein
MGMVYIKILLIYFILNSTLPLSGKITGEASKTLTAKESCDKYLTKLEKRIISLEKRVMILEKKLKELLPDNQEIQISIISTQFLKGATKEAIKLELKIENKTESEVDFIFGEIKLLNSNNEELYSDKFYFDQEIKSFSSSQTVILIESSNPYFQKIKETDNLKLKFIPKKIIKQAKKSKK